MERLFPRPSYPRIVLEIQKYVLTFAAGKLPPLEKGGFISITMYDLPQRALIHNPLERYSIGDRTTGLKRNPDGSVTVYLQPSSPGPDRESNWLPTPPAGPFMYVMRIYLPGEAVQKGLWEVPKPVLAQ